MTIDWRPEMDEAEEKERQRLALIVYQYLLAATEGIAPYEELHRRAKEIVKLVRR